MILCKLWIMIPARQPLLALRQQADDVLAGQCYRTSSMVANKSLSPGGRPSPYNLGCSKVDAGRWGRSPVYAGLLRSVQDNAVAVLARRRIGA